MGIWGIMKVRGWRSLLPEFDQRSDMIHGLKTDCFVMTWTHEIAFRSRIASSLLAADQDGTRFREWVENALA